MSIDQVKTAAAELEAAEAAHERATLNLDAAIDIAFKEGLTVDEIAAAAGITSVEAFKAKQNRRESGTDDP